VPDVEYTPMSESETTSEKVKLKSYKGRRSQKARCALVWTHFHF